MPSTLVRRPRLVLHTADAAPSPHDSASTVLALLDEQARRTPTALALDGGDRTWSYRRLLRETALHARRLRDEGVTRETLVALHLPRGPVAIVALLGILRAGGAYVPIDPAYPAARRQFMFADCGARFVVTNDSDLLPESTARRIVLDDAPRGPTPAAPRDEPQPHDLAYAIYTSGSTGRPKAALLEHIGLRHLVGCQREAFRVGPGRRVLAFAPLSFDASVSEIFVTLASGGTLCFADELALAPGPALAETLRARRITDVTLPPTILATLGGADLPDLRTIVVAGERCPAGLAAQWSVGRRFINAYGPTETTVCASLHVGSSVPDRELPDRELLDREPSEPPIGRPLAEFEFLTEGRSGLRAFANGETAELFLAGPGVARGYLGRSELTESRFRPHPHDPQRRVYRTGDLVRRNADGTFQFVARVDQQLKIRGVRVEPDEIARTLERHAGVRQAVVIEDSSAARLRAFVVPRAGCDCRGDAVRDWLRGELPATLWSTSLHVVAALPLTPNGKVDRAALLQSALPPAPANEHAPPRTPLEWQLAGAWQAALGRPVGIRDDFFALGGDSLKALSLLQRLTRDLDLQASLADLLQAPDIERFATLLSTRRTHAWSPLVPLQPRGTRTPFFCVHPGGGNALCYLPLAQAWPAEWPLYALQARGLNGESPPHETIEALAAEYVAAIRGVQRSGPYCLGGWSFGGLVAFEMGRQLLAAGERVDRVVLIDAGRLYCFAVLRTLFRDDRVPLFQLSALDPEANLDNFIAAVGDSQIVPPGADRPIARRILSVFTANVEATYKYRPERAPLRAVLCEATEPFVRVHLRRTLREEWTALCGGGLTWHRVPGNHLSLIRPPHVESLVRCLTESSVSRARAA